MISLGGGSCIDVGKATAAIITNGGPAVDYLEVVGKGKKVTEAPVPFVAIPTTAGTGSEVTKNAVLGSKTQGFKRSMRDDKMVATIAIIDPELDMGCPRKVTATSGIDALTHLIEAYITFRATPISDGLALKGIELAGKYLQRACDDGKDMEAREGMCAAALLGGMAFANSGLGAAHGFGMAVGIRYHLPLSLIHIYYLKYVADRVKGTDVKACVVIDYPFGTGTIEDKCREAEIAIQNGVEIIDYVIDYGHLKSGDKAHLLEEVKACVKAAKGLSLIHI